MAADTDTGLVMDIVKTIGSFVGGAIVMLIGTLRFIYNIKRLAEDANGKADVNAERTESQAGKIAALENFRAATEANHLTLIKGHERIEAKLDRLTERLGG